LTHILGGVAGGMEIIAQRMRIAHGAFDIHAWARVIPLLSNATIQAGIIGPDGWLVSTTLAPAPEPIDLSDASTSASISMAASWQARMPRSAAETNARRIGEPGRKDRDAPRGTVGGSLAHADPAAELPGVAWWIGTSADPGARSSSLRAVATLAA
jgi:hypothetical protein